MQHPRTSHVLSTGGGVRYLLAIALVLAACTGAPPPSTIEHLTIEYATGAIPPPYNYTYVVEATFDTDGAAVTYELAYLYREGMSAAELAQAGYSSNDAISWSGRLSRDRADSWREIARATVLRSPPQPMPGSDTLTVTIVENGVERTGFPDDRGPWELMAREVDQAARAELGSPRSQP